MFLIIPISNILFVIIAEFSTSYPPRVHFLFTMANVYWKFKLNKRQFFSGMIFIKKTNW